MRTKIIFIDIDGPLAYDTFDKGKVEILKGTLSEFTIPYAWVQSDCDALFEIIKQTGAKLVVSSDWRRYYGIMQLSAIFEHYGIGRWEILDITSHFNPRRKLSSTLEWDRACEIHSWVKSYKPINWISIDDLYLQNAYKSLKIPQWHSVYVDGCTGDYASLTSKVDECISKLNRN
jgi:hypothetical protein